MGVPFFLYHILIGDPMRMWLSGACQQSRRLSKQLLKPLKIDFDVAVEMVAAEQGRRAGWSIRPGMEGKIFP